MRMLSVAQKVETANELFFFGSNMKENIAVKCGNKAVAFTANKNGVNPIKAVLVDMESREVLNTVTVENVSDGLIAHNNILMSDELTELAFEMSMIENINEFIF